MDTNTFKIEKAKTGRSGCKGCKEKIEKDELRIAKITASPFSDDSTMSSYFHVKCIFDHQMRQRATTNKIEHASDLEGFNELEDDAKDDVRKHIADFNKAYAEKLARAGKKKSAPKSPVKPRTAPAASSGGAQTKLSLGSGGLTVTASSPGSASPSGSPRKLAPPSYAAGRAASPAPAAAADDDGDDSGTSSGIPKPGQGRGRDNSFYEFRKLCDRVAAHPAYTDKTSLIKEFITKGSHGDKFTGDIFTLFKLLLPLHPKRVYNMKDKQIVKVMSNITGADLGDLMTDLENGDCPETCRKAFEDSTTSIKAQVKSSLSINDVDEFLSRMTGLTKLEDQEREFRMVLKHCTGNDLKYIIRLMKHDLRMNAGPKHILGALDPDAYEAFQASNDLEDVITRVFENRHAPPGALRKRLSVRAALMTPVKPMLAEACKSYESALRKAPRGLYAEIKYDGERVQIHKQGDTFKFFSRSLKAVTQHKVAHFESMVPKACPSGDSLILDSEVLMVDTKTGKPLPFGTLGIHKKAAFKDAVPCLFVFDILQFNGENLMHKSMKERRDLLKKHVTEVKNFVMHSESHVISNQEELKVLMTKVISEGLEGLVLKPFESTYEPGKRHWMKMKKDYLGEGAMADTADLVVLGAYYGTGSKGGIMSIFLMGTFDEKTKTWRTVCKCANGHDDATIDKINRELDVVKIAKDPAKVPSWLMINSTSLLPDFVVPDPKAAPVWEITGAEFTESKSHSANGISIRFPRVTKIRDDKSWDTATNLAELTHLFKASRQFVLFDGVSADGDGDGASAAPDADEDDNEEMADAPPAPSRASKKRKADADEEDDDGSGVVPAAVTISVKDEDDGTHAHKRARKRRRRERCRYSSKCYQTRADHRDRFCHPGDTDWSDDDEGEDEGDKHGSSAAAAIVPAAKAPASDSVMGDVTTSAGRSDDGGRWTCSACTIINEGFSLTYCAMCETPRPAMDAPPSIVEIDDSADVDMGAAPDAPTAAAATAAADLEDIFDGCVFFVPANEEKRRELCRYIIAYAGEVAAADATPDSCTHIITTSLASALKDEAAAKALDDQPLAKIVTPAWLWASLKAGRKVDESAHAPMD
eukprot:m.103651 g.103651  ORF g.103651 m.103651 type:complete len:1100 (+) comp9072_c0_seq1:161-3460(+)